MAENYKISDKKLGRGTFGDVYLATHKKTGEKVAIKKCQVVKDSQGVIALREIKIFQHIIPHKHIVRMLDFSYEDAAFWLVMDYCDRGDLEDYMKKYAPDTDKQLKIMHQCASAVSHMHSLEVPIVHRDIKPSNILFRTEGKSVVAKMADFGLSKILDDMDSVSKAKMGSVLGTEGFMAPELFAKNKYNYTVDIFALGMVYLAMVNFKPTDEYLVPLSASFLQNPGESLKFVGQEMYEAQLSKSDQPVVISVTHVDNDKMKSLKKMIIAMSLYDPSKRMSMKDVLHEIEGIAVGQTTKGMVTGKIRASQVFKSNLDITKTRGKFNPMSSVRHGSSGYGGSSGGDQEKSKGSSSGGMETVVKPKEQKGEGSGMGGGEGEDEDEVPDIGYILMRQMAEDHMKQKHAEEAREKKGKAESQTLQLEHALPLLKLLKLLHGSDSTKFEVGDRVLVETDLERAKRKQVNHGGWHDLMDMYLGEEGIVKEIKRDRIEVQFPNGHKLTWNESLLERPDDKPSGKASSGTLKKSKFKMHDLVEIKVNAKELERIQRNGSEWRDRMKKSIGIHGVVHRIHYDGDVLVEFLNHDKWWLRPDALQVVDVSDQEIEAGDQVIVIDDKALVKQLQKGHGEWADSMTKCLGQSGIVRKSDTRISIAVVEIEDTKYCWNQKCLKLIVKSEEMILMMLKRRLFDG